MADTEVRLTADPAGYPAAAQGSWLHPLGFRQQAVTSALDSAHFTGIPPECIIAYHRAGEDFRRHLAEARGSGFQPGASPHLEHGPILPHQLSIPQPLLQNFGLRTFDLAC